MPITRCTSCDRITNSDTSNYWLDIKIDGKTPKEMQVATECYAAFVNGRWIEGCVYRSLNPARKKAIDRLIANQENVEHETK